MEDFLSGETLVGYVKRSREGEHLLVVRGQHLWCVECQLLLVEVFCDLTVKWSLF